MAVKPKLAPSLLAADFAALGSELQTLQEAGADMVHFDVMDGHFVPNLSFGLPVLERLRRVTPLPFDVHLMTANPLPYLERYAEAGADCLCVHWEAVEDAVACMKRIRALGVKPGFALRPGTPVKDTLAAVPWAGRVLIMSVEPGFGGQRLLPDTLRKAEELATFAAGQGLDGLEIAMDGGIDLTNLRRVLDAGVNVVVAGSAVIAATPGETLRQVRAFLGAMGR
jgi:ribulose-phosphate 3-epimerase